MVASEEVLHRVQALLEPILKSEGMELADLEFKGGRGRGYLRVYIDREGGVTLEDCANVSRQLGQILDVEDVMEQSYVLEVSSPGLDRPLKRAEDYRRFSGRLAKISTYAPVQGKKVFAGRLKGIEEETVIMEEEGGILVSIPFPLISKGRLEVEF